MFPDGMKLGVNRIMAAMESGLTKLQEVLDWPEAAREIILGHTI